MSRNRSTAWMSQWLPAVASITAMLGFVLLGYSVACAQVTSNVDQSRQLIALPVENSVVKRFASAKEYLRDGQWGEAVDLLQRIVNEHGETLVPVADDRFLNVAAYSQLLAGNLPAEGLAVYRSQVDSRAKLWWDEALQSGKSEPLQRIVRSALISSFGERALNRLAEQAWEAGRFDLAREYWSRLLPTPAPRTPGEPMQVLHCPDAAIDRPMLLAKLICCRAFAGQTELAEQELQAFRTLAADARGELAGREGPLADILAEIIRRSQSDGHARSSDVRPQMTTFAEDAARNGRLSTDVDAGAARWAYEFPGDEFAARSAPLDRREPSVFPLIWQGQLYFSDARRVWAYDLATGEPAWDGDVKNASAVIYPPVAVNPPSMLTRPTKGDPYYTLTVADGKLFAKMGPPVTDLSRREMRIPASELICLDLERGEGRLLWKITAAELATEGSGWMFEGTPVAGDGRLYVGIRQSLPETQTYVACLAAQSGRLVWLRKIGAFIQGEDERFNTVGHRLLTLTPRSVICATELGAIASLDRHDGVPQWVRTYRAGEPADFPGMTERSRGSSRGLTPPLAVGEFIVTVPEDSSSLLVLDQLSGRTLWQREVLGGVRYLLGVEQGTLFVSGEGLTAIDLRTGRTRWEFRYHDPEGFGFGRGLLSAGLVYWPTHDEVFVFDGESGRMRRRISLGMLRGETGGHLAAANGFLVVSQPGRVIVLGESPLNASPGDNRLSLR